MSALDDLGAKIEELPLGVLLVGHCFLISLLFWHLRDRYLLSFWVGLMAAVGGGVVSGYLLQDPTVAPNPVFAVNGVFVIWTACWWLVNYFPYGMVARLMKLLPAIAACKVCTNVLRVGTMVARVDAATKVYPGVWAAPLVLGTIGASGGKFIVDAILISSGLHKGPAELTVPGFAWRSGALGASAYYAVVHIFQRLSPREGRALITTAFVAHGLLSDLTGRPLDFTEPVARLLHALTNVPPPLRPAVKAEAAAADSKIAKKSN